MPTGPGVESSVNPARPSVPVSVGSPHPGFPPLFRKGRRRPRGVAFSAAGISRPLPEGAIDKVWET